MALMPGDGQMSRIIDSMTCICICVYIFNICMTILMLF